jgi:hypothetical protein
VSHSGLVGTFRQIGSLLHADIRCSAILRPIGLVSSLSRAHLRRLPPLPRRHCLPFHVFLPLRNLNFLGLPLDWEIKVPASRLLTFAILLGFLAVRLTGGRRRLLAPLMLFLRSSLAFFTQLTDEIGSNAIVRARADRAGETCEPRGLLGSTPATNGALGRQTSMPTASLDLRVSGLLVVLLLVLPTSKAAFSARARHLEDVSGRTGGVIGICLFVACALWHGSALVALLWACSDRPVASTAGVCLTRQRR